MDVLEAIQQRRSIRGFKPDAIEKETLEKILSTACRAPSAMNTQPWEFCVIGGDTLATIKAEVVEKLNAGEEMKPEHHVTGWGKDSVYRTRQVELAKGLFKLMDIKREDNEKRAWWMQRGFRFFDAPAAIIIMHDRELGESTPLLDLGAVMQNICLAALPFGLGTCIEDQGVLYPQVVRKHIDIPDSKRIIIAIAVGYPDWEFPANKLVSDREPVDALTTWVGF